MRWVQCRGVGIYGAFWVIFFKIRNHNCYLRVKSKAMCAINFLAHYMKKKTNLTLSYRQLYFRLKNVCVLTFFVLNFTSFTCFVMIYNKW